MKKKDDWVAGYYCAVACLLRKEGCASTEINELFREGADVEKILSSADETDLQAFRDAGLLAANA